MREKHYRIVRVLAFVLLMVVSITVLAPRASRPETYRGTIAKLDEKQETVMKVTAAATVSSIGLAAFPDDATTPVANKIMDLAGYLVLVLCALIMEKYLLTIAGYLVFQWMIPAVCVLLGINTFARNKTVAKLAVKLFVLSLTLILVVPLSVRLSDLIEKTYQVSVETDMEEKGEEVLSEAETIISEKEETEGQTSEGGSEEETVSGWDSFRNSVDSLIGNIQNAASQLADAASEAASSAASAVGNLTDKAAAKAQDMLSDLVETVVVLIVTNCIIPVLVLVFLLWIMKLVLEIQIDLPDHTRRTGYLHKKADKSE